MVRSVVHDTESLGSYHMDNLPISVRYRKSNIGCSLDKWESFISCNICNTNP